MIMMCDQALESIDYESLLLIRMFVNRKIVDRIILCCVFKYIITVIVERQSVHTILCPIIDRLFCDGENF